MFDRVVGTRAAHDPEAERRARIAVSTALVGMALGVLYTARLHGMLEDPLRAPLSLVMASFALVSAISLGLYRLGLRLEIALHLGLGYLIAACAVLGYFLGGLHGPILYWLCMVPAVSLFAGSTRSGLVCFTACQLVYAAFGWITWQGFGFAAPPSKRLLAELWFGSMCGLIVTSWALVLVFERAKERALHRLAQVHVAHLRARDDANAASRGKAELLARIGLAIRTPLRGLLAGADGLALRMASAHAYARSLHTLRWRARQLAQSVDDLLDLAQSEAGGLEIECVRCDPHAIVRDVLAQLQLDATRRCIDLCEHWAPDIPIRIVSDPKRLRQILLPLVAQAIRLRDSRAVRIAVHCVRHSSAAPLICFDVSATGADGVPEHVQDLFESRTQALAGAPSGAPGALLGLALALQLCRRLGGELRLEHTASEGSTFRVELPVHGPDAADEGCVPSGSAAGWNAPPASDALRGLTGVWERSVRWFVPPGLDADPGARHRARIVVGLAMAPMTVVLPWTPVLAWAVDPPAGAVLATLLALNAPIMWSIPVLLRFTGSIRLAANALMAHVVVTLAAFAYCGGGAASPGSYWLLLVPAGAPLLGLRSTQAWTALVLVLCATFYALHRMGASPHDWLPPARLPWVSLASAATLCGLTSVVMLLYERTHSAAIQELADLNRDTAVARRAAERASQGKSTLFESLRDELRAPAAAVLDCAELLAHEWSSSDSHKDLRGEVDAIHDDARRLLALLDDLLDPRRAREPERSS